MLDSDDNYSVNSDGFHNQYPQGLENSDNVAISKTITSNIITRTSTILSYIKEDNKFAKTQVEPNPSYDPNEIIKPEGTASYSLQNYDNIGKPIVSTKRKNADLENIKSAEYNEEHDDEQDEDDDEDNETKKSNAVLEDTGEYNVFDIENRPPDKGFWAWTCAFCVLSINTFSWGANSAFGVYLNYYTTMEYFPGASMEQYVMIGGLCLGLSFIVCPITVSLCRRYYFKITMSIGTGLIFLSYWLASISKTVIQLIMFQGFLMSIGFALVAGSCFIILPTWFLKKRSITQGIASAGAGLGGIIFSRPVDQIIKSYLDNPKYANNQHEALRLGISWSLRMQSFVCGFMLVISVILIRTYRPLIDPKVKEKPFIHELYAFLVRFDILKQIPVLCVIFWNMIYGLAYTILLFSLSSYATSIGLTYQQGSNVTTVQSVAQTIGRPLMGMCSDKIGRVNSTIFFTTLITIFIFFFWIFVTTYSALLAFAFLVGFILGINWVNFGPMTADIVGGGMDLTHTISMMMFTGGFPFLIAELVGLKLKRPEMEKPFLYCQILCGVSCIISVLVLLPFREWKVKRILNARRKQFLPKLTFDDTDETTNIENETINKGQFINEKAENELNRLDKMLENNVSSYLLRMFYPIAV
ncbi:hypothetical protein C6P40_004664 [Pichia californica]|uniref:Major facilitator superfamily (MFS) profile domain-containing protein n=1 Tax=Pichia californica TaxID=460514 RepID=A0A9P7BHP0_9ASCO|nr:hypothetical protein C6P42_005125 [[Candida] californica]KAG0689673.1 hypothetical protein C6P40_004664 [[Candida] californica]